MESLKGHYVENTQVIDRSQSHLEALQAALDKNRIPNKLQVNVKPLAVNKDDPTLLTEWNEEMRQH